MKHIGTTTLETERLILRRFTIEDAESMFNNWASDNEVTKFLTWPAHRTIEDSKWFINFCLDNYSDLSFYNWGMELKDTHELIGNISIVHINEDTNNMILGWVIGKKYWGNGYAPEAGNKMVDVMFNEVGVNCIVGLHDVNNPKSGRAMHKMGMKFEGIIRQCNRNNQGIVDCARYSILKSER